VNYVDSAAPTQIQRRLLSVLEAAQSLGISRAMAYKLLTAGELASVRVGDRRLVPVTAVDAFIERLTAEAGRERVGNVQVTEERFPRQLHPDRKLRIAFRSVLTWRAPQWCMTTTLHERRGRVYVAQVRPEHVVGIFRLRVQMEFVIDPSGLGEVREVGGFDIAAGFRRWCHHQQDAIDNLALVNSIWRMNGRAA